MLCLKPLSQGVTVFYNPPAHPLPGACWRHEPLGLPAWAGGGVGQRVEGQGAAGERTRRDMEAGQGAKGRGGAEADAYSSQLSLLLVYTVHWYL